jgi:hypothetical protein
VTCSIGAAIDLDCTAAVTGSHTISVRDNDGTRTGTITLWVQKLNNPVGCATVPFAVATPIKITRGAETCQRVDAATGDVIHIHVTGTDTSSETGIQYVDIAFIEPTGKVTCSIGAAIDLDCTAAVTGSHTISVRDNDGTRTGTITLWVQKRK